MVLGYNTIQTCHTTEDKGNQNILNQIEYTRTPL